MVAGPCFRVYEVKVSTLRLVEATLKHRGSPVSSVQYRYVFRPDEGLAELNELLCNGMNLAEAGGVFIA